MDLQLDLITHELELAKENLAKFQAGNKSAGQRLRKNMLAIQKATKVVRVFVLT